MKFFLYSRFMVYYQYVKKALFKVALGIALFLIWIYQKILSPLKPACCRFTPTCSAYAREAFLLHGITKGAILTFKRIIRCHPWGGFGYDPVPPKQKDIK